MDISFSVNLFDSEGEIYQEGIFLHMDETTIIKVEDLGDLDNVIEQLQAIRKEIKANY